MVLNFFVVLASDKALAYLKFDGVLPAEEYL